MAKKKEGWQKGLGKFAKDGPKITELPAQNEDARGKDISREVERDYPIRGVREGFS